MSICLKLTKAMIREFSENSTEILAKMIIEASFFGGPNPPNSIRILGTCRSIWPASCFENGVEDGPYSFSCFKKLSTVFWSILNLSSMASLGSRSSTFRANGGATIRQMRFSSLILIELIWKEDGVELIAFWKFIFCRN
jgi:hypothetical protein